jgi:hypothetical protein
MTKLLFKPNPLYGPAGGKADLSCKYVATTGLGCDGENEHARSRKTGPPAAQSAGGTIRMKPGRDATLA